MDIKDFTHINCENPQVILHPYARQYFAKYGKFCVGGSVNSRYVVLSSKVRYELFPKLCKSTFTKPDCLPIQSEIDSKYYFVSSDGEALPMFIVVPCGHCALCDKNKRDDFGARCALETLESKYPPVFITLTYDNDHLPSDGVSLKDMQDFWKLLRINLNRFFSVPTGEYTKRGIEKREDAHMSLRIAYCAEYGKNTHRPHYHALCWNVPFFSGKLSEWQHHFFDNRGHAPSSYASMDSIIDSMKHSHGVTPLNLRSMSKGNVTAQVYRLIGCRVLRDLIWCSWKKGFVSVQSCRDASGRYVAKYIGKGSVVPAGMNPTFVKWSTRRGLGYKAYEKRFMSILKDNPSLTQLTFTDPKFSSKVQHIKIPAYYRRLLAPSLSAFAAPFKVRLIRAHHNYEMCNYIGQCLNGSDAISDYFWSKLLDKFSLFTFTCKLEVQAVSDIDKKRLIRHCSDLQVNSPLFAHDALLRIYEGIFRNLRDDVEWLLKYPLDKTHIMDVIRWKALHSVSVQDYVNSDNSTLRDKLYIARNEEIKFDQKTRI